MQVYDFPRLSMLVYGNLNLPRLESWNPMQLLSKREFGNLLLSKQVYDHRLLRTQVFVIPFHMREFDFQSRWQEDLGYMQGRLYHVRDLRIPRKGCFLADYC